MTFKKTNISLWEARSAHIPTAADRRLTCQRTNYRTLSYQMGAYDAINIRTLHENGRRSTRIKTQGAPRHHDTHFPKASCADLSATANRSNPIKSAYGAIRQT